MNQPKAIDMPQLLQAIRILGEQAREEDLGMMLVNCASRAFHANLITRVRRLPPDRPRFLVVEIHFAGLYGGLGALPSYFTDAIIENRSSSNGLRDFLDMFNHRFLETLYDIWRRQQIFLENLLRTDQKTSVRYDRFLRSLGGIPDDRDQHLGLRCLYRHHLALMQRKPKTTKGLLHLLQAFFPRREFAIDEHVEQILDIPEHQRARLDSHGGLSLGSKGSFLIGSRIRDINGKFRIRIAQLDYATYMDFLPGGEAFEQLNTLVNTYTESQWAIGLQLELRADEIPQTKLDGSCRLGANGWLLSGKATADAATEFGQLAA